MNFSLLLVILALGLYGLGFFIPLFWEFAGTWMWPALVIGYATMTQLLYRWLTRAAQKSPHAFVTAMNGSTTVKMLVSMVLVGAYLLTQAVHRVEFSMGLFAVFMSNTVLLVLFAQREVSKQRKAPEETPKH